MSELPRILVAGGSFIEHELMREVCKLWSRVIAYLDPNIDIAVFDSCSPFDPAAFLHWPVVESTADVLSESKWIHRFPDNIGHLSRGGQDGAGRSYCTAVQTAIDKEYDYLAYIETDLIFLRSITEICLRMRRNGCKVCALPNFQYQFPEFGVTVFDVKWAKDFNFVGKYDWLHSQPWPIPEVRLMNMLKDHLLLLPLYGMRCDQIGVSPDTLSSFFPYFPPAWVTHAQSFDIYAKAVMLNNIQLG